VSTPSEVWSALDAATRQLAAEALYDRRFEAGLFRRDADRTLAAALRFREAAVARLPVRRRVDYLLHTVPPTDELASTLLMALHLAHRAPMLATFLDALAIPHTEGLVDPHHDLKRPDRAALSAAVAELRQHFPPAEVEVYLASLVAMDPGTWGELAPVAP
jgi:hypothetical protein